MKAIALTLLLTPILMILFHRMTLGAPVEVPVQEAERKSR